MKQINQISLVSKSGIVTLLFITVLLYSSDLSAQIRNENSDKDKLLILAEAVINNASFEFVDNKTEIVYKSFDEAPANVFLSLKSPYNDWRYWNGVLNIAMMRLSEVTGNNTYKNFAMKNVKFGFETYSYYQKKHIDENKWSFPFGQFFMLEELDDGGAIGASVIEVNKYDYQNSYAEYIQKVADHMTNKQTRLEDKTYVRSFPHEWTLWADDLYMGLSFLTRMYENSGEEKYLDDAVLQVINFHKYLFDEQKELMYHNWYSDLDRKGIAFWGRANGWAVVAQADLLDRLPFNHPKRDELIKLFQKHILGIAKYQGINGLWHQVLDKEDSYFETSCSAMFIYAVARGVNKKYLEKRYASIAIEGWKGVLSKIKADGQVEGVCTGTVVSDNLVDYYNRPAPLNDVHGIGTVILAGAEMITLLQPD